MVDQQSAVCCLCGDVGFSDKLFRCSNCRHRFQHSYCSNYYREIGDGVTMEVCDWCQCEKRNNNSPSPRGGKSGHAGEGRSSYSGERIKRHDGGSPAEKAAGKTSSPRPIRRFKLLKDVMC